MEGHILEEVVGAEVEIPTMKAKIPESSNTISKVPGSHLGQANQNQCRHYSATRHKRILHTKISPRNRIPRLLRLRYYSLEAPIL